MPAWWVAAIALGATRFGLVPARPVSGSIVDSTPTLHARPVSVALHFLIFVPVLSVPARPSKVATTLAWKRTFH